MQWTPLIAAFTLLASRLPVQSDTISGGHTTTARVLCAQIDLNAHCLAASGCSGDDVAVIASRLNQASELRNTLASVSDSLVECRQNIIDIQEQLEQARTDVIRTQLRTLIEQRKSLETQRESSRAQLVEVAVTDLDEAKAQMLRAALRARGHAIPVQVAVTLGAEADLRETAKGLIAARRADRLGVEVPARFQLAPSEESTSVQAAAQRLAENLPAVRAALAQPVSE